MHHEMEAKDPCLGMINCHEDMLWWSRNSSQSSILFKYVHDDFIISLSGGVRTSYGNARSAYGAFAHAAGSLFCLCWCSWTQLVFISSWHSETAGGAVLLVSCVVHKRGCQGPRL